MCLWLQPSTDIDHQVNSTALHIEWHGFTHIDQTIKFKLGIGTEPGTDDTVPFSPVSTQSKLLSKLTLTRLTVCLSPGSRYVSPRLTVCLSPAHGMSLPGSRYVSPRLMVCLSPAHGMSLPGSRYVSPLLGLVKNGSR